MSFLVNHPILTFVVTIVVLWVSSRVSLNIGNDADVREVIRNQTTGNTASFTIPWQTSTHSVPPASG